MALSLSPHQIPQSIHTLPLSNTTLSLATPRQLTPGVHDNRPNNKTLSPKSSFGHDDDTNKLVRPIPDLPSWTPLRPVKDDRNSPTPEPEVDELATRKATNASAINRLARSPINARITAKNTPTARRTVKSPTKPSGRKRTLFDGVLIATKPSLRLDKQRNAQTRHGPTTAPIPQEFSLVNALTRTFDANRYTPTTPHQSDGTSTGPQTETETTEADDEQLQFNTRLARTAPKKSHARRRLIAVSANASEANSEDTSSLQRPVKRLKQIAYESNSESIDAALGTVQAPISWDAELDFITREEDFVTLPQALNAAPEARMDVDNGNLTAASQPVQGVPSSTKTPAENERRLLTPETPKKPVLSPYQSRGAKFRQRLDAIFGENTAVRTDRVARPKAVDFDFFSSFDDLDKASSHVSDSTESVSSASTREDVPSAIPSTQITSRSHTSPVDTNVVQPLERQHNEPEFSAKPAGEEQMNSWIAALQRLIKGKVHVKEEDLETLSIVLAEIESTKDILNETNPATLELRESIKRLSELHEIPFGDRNKLRQRADDISHAWSPMA